MAFASSRIRWISASERPEEASIRMCCSFPVALSRAEIYKKNEVTFAIICIVIYVVGTSIAESIAETVGIVKLPSMIFHIGFSAILLAWIRKNDLFEKYGLVKPEYKLSKAWFFIPLMLVGLSSVFFGVKLN